MKSNQFIFTDLPFEIIVLILSHLSSDLDVANTLNTCSSLYNLRKDFQLARLTAGVSLESIQLFKNYSSEFGYLTNNRPFNMTIAYYDTNTKLLPNYLVNFAKQLLEQYKKIRYLRPYSKNLVNIPNEFYKRFTDINRKKRAPINPEYLHEIDIILFVFFNHKLFNHKEIIDQLQKILVNNSKPGTYCFLLYIIIIACFSPEKVIEELDQMGKVAYECDLSILENFRCGLIFFYQFKDIENLTDSITSAKKLYNEIIIREMQSFNTNTENHPDIFYSLKKANSKEICYVQYEFRRMLNALKNQRDNSIFNDNYEKFEGPSSARILKLLLQEKVSVANSSLFFRCIQSTPQDKIIDLLDSLIDEENKYRRRKIMIDQLPEHSPEKELNELINNTVTNDSKKTIADLHQLLMTLNLIHLISCADLLLICENDDQLAIFYRLIKENDVNSQFRQTVFPNAPSYSDGYRFNLWLKMVLHGIFKEKTVYDANDAFNIINCLATSHLSLLIILNNYTNQQTMIAMLEALVPIEDYSNSIAALFDEKNFTTSQLSASVLH